MGALATPRVRRLFTASNTTFGYISGGGMFNAYGELVGVVTSQITDGQNLNFGVPINYARGLLATEATMTLAELKIRFPASSADPTSPNTETAASDDATESTALLEALLEGAAGLQVEKVTDQLWSTTYGPGTNVDVVTVYFSVYEQ